MITNFPAFRNEVKKALIDHEWKCQDLAAATGYSIHSIYSVMNGGRCSDKMADKIIEVLELPKRLAT